MIYLFDRLYLELDHYVRNDQKKMTALLGPIAEQAEDNFLLRSDFGPIQRDVSIPNEELASYLQNLVISASGKRVTVFTDNDTLIKILAFYCSSVFNNPSKEFIKQLIMFDKLWIDQAAGIAGHRDIALRHKGTPILDVTNLDALVDEAMAITPKLANYSVLRMEYLYGAYLNNTLPIAYRGELEHTVKTVFYDANWLGQLVKTFSPLMLTIAANEGVNLDTFTIEELKRLRPEYYKIYDTAILGDDTCFDRVELSDWLAFFNRASQDFGWNLKPSLIQFFTDFYANKREFIIENCLNPANAFNWYCLVDLGKTVKINPHIWYYIAREHNNPQFINNFVFRI